MRGWREECWAAGSDERVEGKDVRGSSVSPRDAWTGERALKTED